MSFKVSPAAGAPTFPALPVAIGRDSRAESSAGIVETQRREQIKKWAQIVENGWRELIRTTSSASGIDLGARVSSEIQTLFKDKGPCIRQRDFSPEEIDQMLLFAAKIPAFFPASTIKPLAELYLNSWCMELSSNYSIGPSPSNTREAVILNATANDHTELLKELHPSLTENPQLFALAYLIALEKKGSALDTIMDMLKPRHYDSYVGVMLKNFSLLNGETFSLLAKGRGKRISIVNDYVRHEPFDLDTVMLVWEALGLDEGAEREVVIASLEARIGSLSDEEKGKAEAFRNKIRESR